jgi:4'-phosphopantetheinyl transferase
MPRELEFAYSDRGKPRLGGHFAGDPLQFNLSHCEDSALLAVTLDSPIGADLEHVRYIPDAELLVDRFFSPREHALFHALPAEKQPLAFFNLWTRKEAWLKATGEGISERLREVEVSFLPGEPARFMALPGDAGEVERWHLHSFTVIPGYAAAAAAPAPLLVRHINRDTLFGNSLCST